MPEMDGYEVCKHLKADERTRDIPIIFISALHEAFDKVKAFALGGVDYITKPFQAEREADIFLESFTELQIYINLGLIDMTAYRKEVLWEENAYVAFSSSDTSKTLIDIYDDGIIELAQSGKLQQIFEKWGHPYPAEAWTE